MALLQMHNAKEIRAIEQLKGIITLNYDSLLDRAFNTARGGVNYGMACVSGNYTIRQSVPLLIKLHGSFNWRTGFPIRIVDQKKTRAGEQEEMIWIPPGVEKEMDRYPFNLLWGKAFELLDCDTLRIVGCSLSQNDWGLMSLLFFSQLRSRPKLGYEIEIIDEHKKGTQTRDKNGFLKHVKVLGELDGCQDFVDSDPDNVFETWLKIKLNSYLRKGIRVDQLRLRYVSGLMRWK